MRRNDMANIDDIAYAIGADKKNPTGIKDWFGRVVSMSPFKVARLGSEIGVECVNLAAASVGDMVYVLKRPDGQHVSIGTVGGGALPSVLYDNPSGSNEAITLEDSAANYDYMRIYFRKSGDSDAHNAVDIHEPDGKRASLFLSNAYSSSAIQFVGQTVTISGNTITPYNIGGYYNVNGGGAGTSSKPLYITRVEAWSGGASIGFGGGSGGGGEGGVPVTDVLYNNDTGGSGTITLSKSVAQYDHIRIYFGYETYARSSVDVYNPNGKQVNLFMQQSYDGQYQTIQSANVVPSGNTITMGAPAKFEVNFNDGALFNFAQANNLRIYRVEAWNGTYTSATEATCTLDTTYASTGRSTVKVSKNGGVCTITFMPLVLKAQSGRNVFGTVPEGFRPVNNEYYIHPNGWANESSYIIVGTDGTLKANVNLPSENESWASGTYVIGG